MPYYTNNPFTPIQLMQKNVPCYLLGTRNMKQGDTWMRVSNVVGNGSTATLTVQIYAGEIPIVGALVSVQQLANTAFNVSRAPLTAVSIDATTGAGTISFASATTLSTTADVGVADAEVPEIGEALANGTTAPAALLNMELDYVILNASVSFQTLPTAVTITLEGSMSDIKTGDYVNLGTVATVAASAIVGIPSINISDKYQAYRFRISGLSGTGTAIGKLLY